MFCCRCGQDGGRSRKTSAPRGFEASLWIRRCTETSSIELVSWFENKQMNTMAKALVFLIWFSAPAAWTAEPASVANSPNDVRHPTRPHFEVPVELWKQSSRWSQAGTHYAVSRKGAAGLMQLMPATASRFGVPDRFNIEENIRGGVAYLAWLIRLFNGDLRLAVAAYQVGESQILSRGLAYSSREVFLYVSRVATVVPRHAARDGSETRSTELPGRAWRWTMKTLRGLWPLCFFLGTGAAFAQVPKSSHGSLPRQTSTGKSRWSTWQPGMSLPSACQRP